MLLTTDDEIRSLMPTSKWNDVDMLLSCVEEEEQNVVLNLLGDELMNRLVADYERLKAKYGGITPDVLRTDMLRPDKLEDQADRQAVRAIRICQKIQLFLAVAHNAGLMSVQFNSGGGLNQATAEYYEKADDKSVERFVKDAYMKAHRNTDELLTLLEHDARSPQPLWAEMWKQSRYYFEQSNLLITTALQMQYFLNINSSRQRFIELLPDLQFVQQHYIKPRLGAKLTEAFIRFNTSNEVIHYPYNPEVPTEGEAPTDGEASTEGEGSQHPIYPDAMLAWCDAIQRVRMAMAIFTEWRNPQLRRKESLDEANLSIASAVSYISENQEYFMPYVESSPFYVKPVVEEELTDEERQRQNRCICGEPPAYDPCNPSNKATTIFGLGLRQH